MKMYYPVSGKISQSKHLKGKVSVTPCLTIIAHQSHIEQVRREIEGRPGQKAADFPDGKMAAGVALHKKP